MERSIVKIQSLVGYIENTLGASFLIDEDAVRTAQSVCSVARYQLVARHPSLRSVTNSPDGRQSIEFGHAVCLQLQT